VVVVPAPTVATLDVATIEAAPNVTVDPLHNVAGLAITELIIGFAPTLNTLIEDALHKPSDAESMIDSVVIDELRL
jgi:hypothetical protein